MKMIHFLKNAILGLCISVILVGCITPSVSRSEVEVDLSNGVSAEEAYKLAKEQLKSSEHNSTFLVKKPARHTDILTQDYPDYWFISFPAKDFERGFWSYLVVIHREDGSIPFKGPFVPLKVKGYEWVFDKEEAQRLWGY